MKATPQVVCSITIAITSLMLVACRTTSNHRGRAEEYHGAFTFAVQPESQTKHVNSYVVFAVRVIPEHDAAYQWLFNGQKIEGATKREYFIEKAAVKNVGAYTIRVTWPLKNVNATGAVQTSTNILSDPAFLSVYEIKQAGNGIAGKLTMPAQQFRPAQYSCPKHPTITFGKQYTPADGGGRPFFFYGPNVPLGGQSPPFLNWTHLSHLRIDAIGGSNQGVATALEFGERFEGKGAVNIDCDSSNDSTAGPSLTLSDLGKSSDGKRARYGVTVHTGAGAVPDGKIELNWMYY